MYESDKKDYYKPVRIGNAFSSNYIEYESNGDKDKTLFIDDYLDMIRQYLTDIINDRKSQGEWNIQLTMEINFISSKDSNETRTMHTKSDNIEIMIRNETDKIIDSVIYFDSVNLLYYKFHKTILNRDGSYIDSPQWLKNKKATIDPKDNNDKCFQYAITVALNHHKINNHPERVSNIYLFINRYNWKEIDFPSDKNGWKKFESKNKTVALNILYVPKNSAYIQSMHKACIQIKT